MIGPRQGVFVSRFKPICGCRFLFWMKRLSGALNSPMFSKQGCRPGGWWHHVHSDLPSKKYCECLDSETLGPFRPTDNGQGIFSAVKVVSPSLMCYFELKLRQEKKRGALWFILEHSSPSLWNNFTPSTWTRNHRVCNRHKPDIYLPFSQRTDLCSQLCSELSRPEALRTSFEHVAAVNTDAAVSGAVSGGNIWERSTGHVNRLSEFWHPSCPFDLPLNSRKNSLQTYRSTGSAVSFSNYIDTATDCSCTWYPCDPLCHWCTVHSVYCRCLLFRALMTAMVTLWPASLRSSWGTDVKQTNRMSQCKYLPHVSLNWLPGYWLVDRYYTKNKATARLATRGNSLIFHDAWFTKSWYLQCFVKTW